MIYLDTHVAVWLYAGQTEKISKRAKRLINEHDIYVSPVVRLELQYLFEIDRIICGADELLLDLSSRIGLKICSEEFNKIMKNALSLSWTRDPFDRIIVANAVLNNNILVTRDQTILDNYKNARW